MFCRRLSASGSSPSAPAGSGLPTPGFSGEIRERLYGESVEWCWAAFVGREWYVGNMAGDPKSEASGSSSSDMADEWAGETDSATEDDVRGRFPVRPDEEVA